MDTDDMEFDDKAACQLASALLDGELSALELGPTLDAMAQSAASRERWQEYHLVGEVMRFGAAGARGLHDPAFAARVRQRLGASPAVVAHAQSLQAVAQRHSRRSANDAVWRWKLLAGLSSVFAVAVLGWHMFIAKPLEPTTQLASTPQQGPAAQGATDSASASGPQVMIRDPRLDQLILAHQQMGGVSALQTPAGFLRNATFERPTRQDGR